MKNVAISFDEIHNEVHLYTIGEIIKLIHNAFVILGHPTEKC